jgi:hypothetical protein
MFATGIFRWPGVFDLNGTEYRIESPWSVGKTFDVGKGTQKKWRRVVSDETSWEPTPEPPAAPASKGGGFLKGLATAAAVASTAASGSSAPSGPRRPSGEDNIYGASLFVTDAEDVYIAGNKRFGDEVAEAVSSRTGVVAAAVAIQTGVLWKNGKILYKGESNAEFVEVWLWDTNTVFVVQQNMPVVGEGLSYFSGKEREKSLWLNGEKIATYTAKN